MGRRLTSYIDKPTKEWTEVYECLLMGFGNNEVLFIGIVEIDTTFGEYPEHVTVSLKYYIENVDFLYNSNFNLPMLSSIKVVTSLDHLKMKFSTLVGIGDVMRNRSTARQTYVNTLLANHNVLIVNPTEQPSTAVPTTDKPSSSIGKGNEKSQ